MKTNMKVELFGVKSLTKTDKALLLCSALSIHTPHLFALNTQDANTHQLEEVVVTAQKRAQSVQDIGIAISAFTENDIKDLGMSQPIDMAAQTPGLTIKNVLNKAAPIFTVRGIGNTSFTSNSVAPVGVYVDELFMASSSMLTFSLFDTERVEVLKGPQGTLFGRNTTAGAISFVTKKPTQERDGFVSVTLGDYDVRNIEAAVGGGLTDTVSARLAFKSDYQGEGFFTNRINGGNSDVGTTDTFALRASLLWEFETTAIYWNIHGGRDRSENEPWVGIGRNLPDVLTTLAPELPTGGKYRSSCGDPATTSINFFIHNCVNVNNYKDPYTDVREGEFSQEPSLESDSIGSVLNINWDLDYATLTSVTAYENKDSLIEEDFDGGPFRTGDTSYANDLDVFSQELRLTANEPLFDTTDWIIGALYYQDAMSIEDLYGYLDRVNHDVLVKFDQDTTSWALFAHTETQWHENWKLIAAIRYTVDSITFDGGTFMVNRDHDYTGAATFFSETPLLQDDDIDTSEVTGKLAVEYAPHEDLLTYFSISRGYKAGVWNGFWTYLPGDHAATDPEFINAYELGFKATLLESTMQLNGAVYFYDYSDMQLFADLPAGNFAVFNAGEATVKGVEMDVWWRPNANLDIKAGASYNDTEITGGIGLTQFDSVTPPNTPELTYNALIRYHWELDSLFNNHFFNTSTSSNSILNSGMTASLQMDLAYQDDIFFSLDNLKATSENAYTLVNLRAGLTAPDEQWSATFWVKNLTDEQYFTEILSSGSAGALSGQVGAPRTVGATVTWKWQ